MPSDLQSLRSYGRMKLQNIFLRFLERPLKVKFSKCCSECFHHDTNRRVVFKFSIIWLTGNCALLTGQKSKISPDSPAVATVRITPKICHGQPPTMYSECSRFHPNRFTFGGVIAEHVNTAKMCRKVNPILGWNLASSRIMNTGLVMASFISHNKLR